MRRAVGHLVFILKQLAFAASENRDEKQNQKCDKILTKLKLKLLFY